MLSFAETLPLDCPRCGAPFEAETWLIVDGHERPDLVTQVLTGTLHNVSCPQCAQGGAIPAPLLYHDGLAGRVLFAVPAGMEEREWRETAQGLLLTLIGLLPEAQRLPYLGEVQAEAGLSGIATVIEAEQLAGSPTAEEVPPLVRAIQALLAAHTPAELQQVVMDHAILRDAQAITILRELAHAAFQGNEDEAGTGFSRAADLLSELETLRKQAPPAPRIVKDFIPLMATAPALPDEDPLDELAFAVLRTATGAALAAVVDEHPPLLDEVSDELLGRWAERARRSGKPRIADGMDERRQALRELRVVYAQQQPVLDAVQALLDADDDAAVEEVLVEHGALLTDEADALLAHLAATADPELAMVIDARRAFAQAVRAALE